MLSKVFKDFRKTSLIFPVCALLFLLSSGTGKEDELNPEITFNSIPGENIIEVLYDDELFTAYIFPVELAKPVLMPIIASNGKQVTRGFPLDPKVGERVDHPHQAGFWLNYGNVNGLDFWNNRGNLPEGERETYGFIEHDELLRMEGGNGKGELEVSALWKNYNDDIILRENTTFVFTNSGDTRVIDRVTVLTAHEVDVLFSDNKEGMIALRVARELELPGRGIPEVVGKDGGPVKADAGYHERSTGNYLSSEGLTGNDVWGKRAGWMVLNGSLDGNQVALSIIDHPENPGYPTYWHARDYGLFAANPLGQAEFSNGREKLNLTLPQGESITFRYRILVHSGSHLSSEVVNNFAKDFRR